MSHRHPTLSPVERDCICLLRGPGGPHIAQCDNNFRAKFFGAWGAERFLFYGQADGRAASRPASNRQAA